MFQKWKNRPWRPIKHTHVWLKGYRRFDWNLLKQHANIFFPLKSAYEGKELHPKRRECKEIHQIQRTKMGATFPHISTYSKVKWILCTPLKTTTTPVWAQNVICAHKVDLCIKFYKEAPLVNHLNELHRNPKCSCFVQILASENPELYKASRG